MRHIHVLICQVDDGASDLMNELACFDLATPDVTSLQPETALDATTQEIGTTVLRRLLHAQSDDIDVALVARHCAQRVPAVVHQDGQETVTVASRFGLLHGLRGSPHAEPYAAGQRCAAAPRGDDHHPWLPGMVLSIAAGGVL